MTEHSPSIRPYGTTLRIATVAGLAAAYLLVVLGDTVRTTESGMGCASWPLCNGHVGLAGGYHALLEQLHRYLAAVVTVLVVITFVLAWRQARENRLVYWSATAAVGLIGVEVGLGAITVFADNVGWTVAVHLAVAWLILGAVTVSALGVWRASPVEGVKGAVRAAALHADAAHAQEGIHSCAAEAAEVQPPHAQPRHVQPPQSLVRSRGLRAGRAAPAGHLGLIAVAALFALSVSGMLVLHEGASTACSSWPLCGRRAAFTSWVVLQYVHRSLALLAAVAVGAAVVQAWRSATARSADRALACACAALLAATAAFGAIVATTGAPPLEQDLHLAVASALWIGVVALATPYPPRLVVIREEPAAAAPVGAVETA